MTGLLCRTDRTMLIELVRHAEARDRDEAGFDVEAFRGMLARDRALSDKQRAWLIEVYERVYRSPHYENLVSGGKAPLGRPVELMVRDKPLRPPPRRSDA